MSSARASRLHYAPLPPRDHCHQRSRDASDAVAYFARHLTNAGPVSRGHFGSKLRRRALLLGAKTTRRRRRRGRAAVVVSAAARRAELSTWRETGPLRGGWTSYAAATVGESTRRPRGAARRVGPWRGPAASAPARSLCDLLSSLLGMMCSPVFLFVLTFSAVLVNLQKSPHLQKGRPVEQQNGQHE